MTTLRGVLRSMEASARRSEREAIRRQKELARQQKEFNKLQELERAAYEVELNENNISILQSMHQDCSNYCDWNLIKNLDAPSVPIKSENNEKSAIYNLENFKPTLIHKLFKRIEKVKKSLANEVSTSKRKDEQIFTIEMEKYENEKIEWEENTKLAYNIIEGNLESYKEVFEKLDPLAEINELGTSLNISFPHRDIIVVDLNVHSEEIIPKEIKSLLKSGKLSIKQMPNSKFNEIYQDHICSSVLRIARESFAALPVNKVLITAFGNLLNSQTGYKEDVPILSVLIPEETIKNLNFDSLDPSDSMANFVHNMDFKRTNGFGQVEKIDYNEFV